MSQLVKYLANLGYGTRRDVTRMLSQRRVTDALGAVVRADAEYRHDDVLVDGVPLDPPPGAVVMLHKPVGYVCSTFDVTHPVVYDLLPARFRLRSPVIAPVGRLDQDTSGLLLLTDDGALNHRLTSPRSHIRKVYVATLSEPLCGNEGERFASGALQLAADPLPLAPVAIDVLDDRRVRLTLEEGRYHQVRRMFAAVGNHVVYLERIAVGALSLGDQAIGSWRLLTTAECAMLRPITTPGTPTAP